ncbi:MAG: efflux RND transporter permease subunit [Abditibacteriota bacterium]|nr:efflux RND transporter permease subunit [Abditibacteriota bacterium]
MGITVAAIRRPIMICMFIMALIVFGVRGLDNMSKELIPNVDIPYVIVMVSYSGAGPEEIEVQVNRVIEQNVAGIENLKNLTSMAQDSIGIVVLEFKLGTDINVASADVRDKAASAKRSLPDDADDPIVQKLDINSKPIMNITVRGTASLKELRAYADNTLKDELAACSGVSAVNVNGGEEREIHIDVDKNRLAAYNTNISAISAAVAGATMNLPAGKIRMGHYSYSLRTVGEFDTVDEIKEVMIKASNGRYFRLKDVADIRDGVKELDRYSRIDGANAVTLSVQKISGGNTVEVVDGVKAKIDRLNKGLPASMRIISLTDDGEEVATSLFEVEKTLGEAIVIVVLIVMLFLHSIRGTFIVGIAIPTSLFATFGPMSAFGFSLNMLTMLALCLVIGILVDDSIVVLENIERHLRKGESVVDAAINGRSEIGFAAIAISMVDIVVFLPIAFMGGMIGRMFRQFGITIACAVAFSLMMSFTLAPMLASKFLKLHSEETANIQKLKDDYKSGKLGLWGRISYGFNAFMDVIGNGIARLIRIYEKLLEWTLQNKFTTLFIGTALLFVVLLLTQPLMSLAAGPKGIIGPRLFLMILIGVCWLICMFRQPDKFAPTLFSVVCVLLLLFVNFQLGFNLSPTGDNGRFSVTIRLPEGSSLSDTDKVAKKVEAIIAKLPEMETKTVKYREFLIYNPSTWFREYEKELTPHYITTVGSTSTGAFASGGTGDNYAAISVYAHPKQFRKRSTQEIVDSMKKELSEIAGPVSINVGVSSSFGGGGGGGNGVSYKVTGQDMDLLYKWAKVVAKEMAETDGITDVDISYKPGVPEKQVVIRRDKIAEAGVGIYDVASAVRFANTGNTNTTFRDNGFEYDINVRYKEADRSKLTEIPDFIVSTVNNRPIYLKDVADIIDGFAPNQIDRENRERKIEVTSNMMGGYAMGNVQQVTDAKMAKLNLPNGVRVSGAGMSEDMAENFGYILSALGLAIILVYMLMCALFESLLTPLVIMFTLPQALAGGLLALYITGTIMSIISMIGFIMLIGLVTKNAILLCDVTNQLRQKGLTKHEAIVAAGEARLRPILMTTVAMIGGMLPMAISNAENSEIRAPMAITVIGGLCLSMFLTLLVIPVLYDIVDTVWHWIIRVKWLSGIRKQTEDKEEEWLASRSDDFDPTDVA